MGIQAVVGQIIMMLMIVAIGLFLRRRDVMSPPVVQGINHIVLRVAMPAMILMVTQRDFSPEVKAGFVTILWVSMVVMLGVAVLLHLLAEKKLPADRAPVFSALVVLPNIGYMGLPVVTAMYGEQSALYVAAYIISFNMLLFTLYQWKFSGRTANFARVLLNPGFIACVLALVLFAGDIRLPGPLPSLLTQLGGLTTPLTMLLTGARLADFKSRDMKSASLWGVMGLRLVALPLVVWGVLRLAGLSGMTLGVLTLGTAMPCGVAGLMFAERYKKDAVFAATSVSLSTLLCLVTIPLILWATGV